MNIPTSAQFRNSIVTTPNIKLQSFPAFGSVTTNMILKMVGWFQMLNHKMVATCKRREQARTADKERVFDPNETQENTVFLDQTRNTIIDWVVKSGKSK